MSEAEDLKLLEAEAIPMGMDFTGGARHVKLGVHGPGVRVEHRCRGLDRI